MDSVDDINDARAEMARWVTGAIIATILVLVQAIPVVNVLTDFLAGMFALGSLGATALAYLVIQYVNASNSASGSFNAL